MYSHKCKYERGGKFCIYIQKQKYILGISSLSKNMQIQLSNQLNYGNKVQQHGTRKMQLVIWEPDNFYGEVDDEQPGDSICIYKLNKSFH